MQFRKKGAAWQHGSMAAWAKARAERAGWAQQVVVKEALDQAQEAAQPGLWRSRGMLWLDGVGSSVVFRDVETGEKERS